MKYIILMVLAGLIACSTGKSQVVQDPIFPDNFIIFHEDGKDYLIRDPITSNEDFDNYILFRGDYGKKAEKP